MTQNNTIDVSSAPLHRVVGPSLNLPINSIPDHQKIFYTRVLLSHLWSIYDLGGISMGRSFEAMLLELAMELLGRDIGPIPKEFSEPGDLINKIKDELSRTRLEALGLHRPNLEITGPANGPVKQQADESGSGSSPLLGGENFNHV